MSASPVPVIADALPPGTGGRPRERSHRLLLLALALLALLAPLAAVPAAHATPPAVEVLDEAGVLHGNLYLEGGGDPTLGAYGVLAMARDLKTAGVRKITGAIVGDESYLDSLRGDVQASWGDQMRSYVLNPYQMVKDLRTEFEVGNPQSVFDGDIDGFLEAGIRWRRGAEQAENN